MCGAMVNAVLDDRKNQTRRVAKIVKSLPDNKGWDCLQKPGRKECLLLSKDVWSWIPFGGSPIVPYPNIAEFCPYGKPGDRLWVRETWRFDAIDKEIGIKERREDCLQYRADEDFQEVQWIPSIFMPKWACRLWLEITDVKIQRVGKISEEDAAAEGGPKILGFDDGKNSMGWMSYRKWYKDLWDSLNAKRGFGWDKSPWVWVVKFRRLP